MASHRATPPGPDRGWPRSSPNSAMPERSFLRQRSQAIFQDGRRLFTRSIIPEGIQREGMWLRDWDPRHSKLAAAILKGAEQIGLREHDIVLYLGASTGTTASHVSDIVGNRGFVFALDCAPRVIRDLVFVCERRKNMTPILADAAQPDTFAERVTMVDYVYQDIAQRDQARIFLLNCSRFLEIGGFAALCVKARSIDVARHPREIFLETRKLLEEHLTIVDSRELEPFERDHCIFFCKKTRAFTIGTFI
ncbi:MAG: fibrillarin-like rRNA/tRNA 2'-O-methyltransferase [Nanoarchaeota archaeon]